MLPVASAIVGLGVLVGVAVFLFRRIRKRPQTDIRISVSELNQQITRHEPLVILDLRHPLDVLASPQLIPGAIPVRPDQLDSDLGRIEHDSPIVLYCTCPNEETSLSVHRQLTLRGFQQAKVLTGGLPAWKRANLPIQDLYPELEQQMRRRAAARP